MKFSTIVPFGTQIDCGLSRLADKRSILDLDIKEIGRCLSETGLVLIRGHQIPSDQDFIAFAERLGSILQWEFGPILELKISPTPANHIFTSSRVELHWDGAFIEDKPHYNLFNCITGTDAESGGQTLFVDSRRVLHTIPDSTRRIWESTVVRYSMEKKAHYGGTIEQTIVDTSPYSNEPVIRYIEAFNEDYMDINPMQVNVVGMEYNQSQTFLTELNSILYTPELMYKHSWTSGDFVIADNSVLLHGRSRFTQSHSGRFIKRINVV